MLALLVLAQSVISAEATNLNGASYTLVARTEYQTTIEATRLISTSDSMSAYARLLVEFSGSGNDRFAVVTVDSLSLRYPVVPIQMVPGLPSGDTTYTERFELCRIATPTDRAPSRMCPPTSNPHLAMVDVALDLLFPGLDGNAVVRPGMPPSQTTDTVLGAATISTIKRHHWASVGPRTVQDSVVGSIEHGSGGPTGRIANESRDVRTFHFDDGDFVVRAVGLRSDETKMARSAIKASLVATTLTTVERDNP